MAKLKWLLTIAETLNINYNMQASTAMLAFPDNILHNHPLTTNGYPHPTIDGAVQI